MTVRLDAGQTEGVRTDVNLLLAVSPADGSGRRGGSVIWCDFRSQPHRWTGTRIAKTVSAKSRISAAAEQKRAPRGRRPCSGYARTTMMGIGLSIAVKRGYGHGAQCGAIRSFPSEVAAWVVGSGGVKRSGASAEDFWVEESSIKSMDPTLEAAQVCGMETVPVVSCDKSGTQFARIPSFALAVGFDDLDAGLPLHLGAGSAPVDGQDGKRAASFLQEALAGRR